MPQEEAQRYLTTAMQKPESAAVFGSQVIVAGTIVEDSKMHAAFWLGTRDT